MSGGKQVPRNLKNGRLNRTVFLTEVSQAAMIPPFEENGYLPPGVYLATLEEVSWSSSGELTKSSPSREHAQETPDP
jgi:hypothetical protein